MKSPETKPPCALLLGILLAHFGKSYPNKTFLLTSCSTRNLVTAEVTGNRIPQRMTCWCSPNLLGWCRIRTAFLGPPLEPFHECWVPQSLDQWFAWRVLGYCSWRTGIVHHSNKPYKQQLDGSPPMAPSEFLAQRGCYHRPELLAAPERRASGIPWPPAIRHLQAVLPRWHGAVQKTPRKPRVFSVVVEAPRWKICGTNQPLEILGKMMKNIDLTPQTS